MKLQSSFYKWVIEQEGRNDPVGDLADDILSEKRISKLRRVKKQTMPETDFPSMLAYLGTLGIDTSGAKSAMLDAHTEFFGYA